MSFDQFVQRAAGSTGVVRTPYDYQRRLADEGLPELLCVPTGAGKTMAAVLPWIYRRLAHPEPQVRAQTPRWLVIALPMRVLVEQTVDQVRSWVAHLGLTEQVSVYEVMGGEDRVRSDWRYRPGREAVFVGTVDMLLSRTLNRGYGEGRFTWPIDFGLLNNGCQWVFDEVQLMGPALPTSRQLEGLRRKLGTAMPCRSMWMSATVPEDSLQTVDLPEVASRVELSAADQDGPLRRRLAGKKLVEQVIVSASAYEVGLAEATIAAHRPGTRTIVVVNTVERARKVHAAIAKRVAPHIDPVLVHSRFRPLDRRAVVARALADVDAGGPGAIIVSTQVLEAGVDISSATMITEAAPWTSVVQRAGRCNRDGLVVGARLLWTEPPRSGPYEDDDVESSIGALKALEGRVVTPLSLGGMDVPVSKPVHQVLRRRDLLDLFDTSPDLGGNDIDVSRFIRDAQGADVSIAWRDLPEGPPGAMTALPAKNERCPVSVAEAQSKRARLVGVEAAQRRPAWRFDHLSSSWEPIRSISDISPGSVLIVDAGAGGYLPAVGWAPESKVPVEPATEAVQESPADSDLGIDAEPLSIGRPRWLELCEHLGDVEAQVRELMKDLAVVGITPAHGEAAAVAGRLHDIGKAHSAFVDLMKRCVDDADWTDELEKGVPFAKSGGKKQPSYTEDRRGFRHELASALALIGGGAGVLDEVEEKDLVVYLVAAHHGRVRMGIRALPADIAFTQRHRQRAALGVHQGDGLPEIRIPGGVIPPVTLDLSVMELGETTTGERSWASRSLMLRDREDLGPFRLAFLEAVVRLADWRASASAEEEVVLDA